MEGLRSQESRKETQDGREVFFNRLLLSSLQFIESTKTTATSHYNSALLQTECMGAAARLKREDCGRTKHDSAFSGWKVLVGPSDWEDFSLGKEGAERYRVHNLPRISSPGIYELGAAVSRAKSGRQISKLDPSYIIVVYLGQADCVRTRLQQYGRSGAHLGRDSSTVCPNNCKSCCSHKRMGLFEEILCRGYSIVFRWAPMHNKADALRTEAQLLNTFDYAWNKGSNSARRPTDILQKLDQVASNTIHISTITRKFLPFLEKKVGIKIKGKLLLSPPENKEKPPGDEESNFLYRIFKVSRTRPIVLDGSALNKYSDSTDLCGVSLGNGAICRNPPLKGRKRCLDHKGLKINALLRSQIPLEKNCSDCEASDDISPVCGFIMGNGSSCENPPVQGRKRCSDHKGQRIRKPDSLNNKKIKSPVFETSYDIGKLENPVLLQQCKVEMKNGARVCGVEFGDGTFCMKQPVKGRVRCEGHKGMRVNRVKKYTITT